MNTFEYGDVIKKYIIDNVDKLTTNDIKFFFKYDKQNKKIVENQECIKIKHNFINNLYPFNIFVYPKYNIRCLYKLNTNIMELSISHKYCLIFRIELDFNTIFNNDKIIRYTFLNLQQQLKEKYYYEDLLKLCHTGK